MKILFYSPSPQSKTGYGTAVRYAIPYLTERGHDVHVYAYNGQPGSPINYNGAIVWPRGASLTDYVLDLITKLDIDMTIVVCDPWIAPAEFWRQVADISHLAYWFPIHAHPLHPTFFDVCNVAETLMCYSDYGTQVARTAGLPCHHVPLGFEPTVYHPQDKAACRKWFEGVLGFKVDGPLIGMVAANAQTMPRDRKGFSIAMQAFQMLKEERGGLLYVHTRPDDIVGGEHLGRMAEILRIDYAVKFESVYDWATSVDDLMMARLYGAFDVLLAPSRVEGFGLPMLEAQACGTPVVMTDSSSLPELLFYGSLAKPAQWDLFDTIAGGWHPVPSVENTFDALMRAVDGDVDAALNDSTHEWMRLTYSWDTVMKRFCEALRL